MTVKEYVKGLTSEEFERLCEEYLSWLHEDKNIIVHGTSYKKDGGKDIVAEAQDVPYEIWAECKKHERSIGLETIAKNVVLVISKGIKELLFFSTSEITRNARKHISIVSQKHDFRVAFYAGKSLIDELSQMPRFKEENFIQTLDIAKDKLEIIRYLSPFEDSEQCIEQESLTLQRDNTFYIDLFISNLYTSTVEDVKCKIPSVPGIQFCISEIDKEFNMLKKTARFIQIRAEVLNCYAPQVIPRIVVTYKVNGTTNKETIQGGTIDPTKLIYYPLIGENVHTFLNNDVSAMVSLTSFPRPYIIKVIGLSGTGKSRLLSECTSKARIAGFHVLYCDAKRQEGFDILREMICTCIGLPYGKGNISCTLEEFYLVIAKYNGHESASHAIYNFVFLQKANESILYYIKEALILFSQKPVGSTKLFFALDNIQCLAEEVLDILYNVIYKLENKTCNTIFGLCTNTEIIPLENRDSIMRFLDKLDEFDSTKCIKYTCDEMQDSDAELLYLHAIQNLQDYGTLINKLVNVSGKRPFEIIMTIHFLHDKYVVRQNNKNIWELFDVDGLLDAIVDIPKKSVKLIKERLEMQKQRNDLLSLSLSYFQAFKLMAKSVLYFDGSAPVAFLETIGLDDEIQFEINQSFFFKYDDKYPTISFFHDNIHRYFEKIREYENDRNLSLKIVEWLENNTWYCSNIRSTVVFECYMRACEYDRGIQFGLDAIAKEWEKRNFEAVKKIGEEIVDKHIDCLTKIQQFHMYYAIADSCRVYVNFSQSIEFFEKACDILFMEEELYISDSEKCKFYHRYVNAYIAEPRYNKVLEALDKFVNGCSRDAFYEFILHNRYSVAYLALGEISEAENSINTSLTIAQENEKTQWESVSYSDKAYIFYRAHENKEETIAYFNNAVNKHIPEEASMNRTSEILAQEAFVRLLEGDLENAKKRASEALQRSKQINGTAMEVKSRNLYAITKFFSGETESAINLWSENIFIATQRKNMDGLVKTYTNLGSVHLIQRDYSKAIEYFEMAYQKYRMAELSLMTHKPLIYNLLYVYDYQNDLTKKEQLLKEEYFDNLVSFCNELSTPQKRLSMHKYWPLQYDNYFLNY